MSDPISKTKVLVQYDVVQIPSKGFSKERNPIQLWMHGECWGRIKTVYKEGELLGNCVTSILLPHLTLSKCKTYCYILQETYLSSNLGWFKHFQKYSTELKF